MSDYLLEFEAHIVEDKRPEGFPRSVFVRQTYSNIETEEQLRDVYNQLFSTMVKNPGITVFPENEIIDTTKIRFDQRTYVPWHMISHLRGDATLITPLPPPKSPLESLNPSGVVQPEKELVKN